MSKAACVVARWAVAWALVSEGGAAWAQGEPPQQAAPAAKVEEPLYRAGGAAGLGLFVGARAGVGLSQVASPLGASFLGELEVGWDLPLPEPVGRDLALVFGASWSGPSVEGEGGEDPRVGGAWSYQLQLQQWTLSPGVLYRVPVGSPAWRPYVSAGARVVLTRALVEGEAGGEPFGDHEELDVAVGGFGALGAEWFVGPGALLGEVQGGWAPLDGFAVQGSGAGGLGLLVGYRLFL